MSEFEQVSKFVSKFVQVSKFVSKFVKMSEFVSKFVQAFGMSAMECYADAAAYNDPVKIEAAITAGTLVFNATDAAACVAGITFPACTAFWTDGPNAPAACNTALVGKVADGGTCAIDYECSNVMSYCDDTTKKCTVDTTGARTTPSMEIPLHLQSAGRR